MAGLGDMELFDGTHDLGYARAPSLDRSLSSHLPNGLFRFAESAALVSSDDQVKGLFLDRGAMCPASFH